MVGFGKREAIKCARRVIKGWEMLNYSPNQTKHQTPNKTPDQTRPNQTPNGNDGGGAIADKDDDQ